ncbi:MAG: hypothetical protein RR909_01440 [Bacilli bacterium]
MKNPFKIKFYILFAITLSLSSCGPIIFKPIDDVTPSVFENFTMLSSYYNKYILPTNPKAEVEDTEYSKFISRIQSEDKDTCFFVAWEIDKTTKNWNLEFATFTYSFKYKIKFLLYKFDDDIFYTPLESYEKGLLNNGDLFSAFNKMPELISYSKIYKESTK